MMPIIRIPDSVYQRLQKHAVPFVDSPASVIERLLDAFELSDHPLESSADAPSLTAAAEATSGQPGLLKTRNVRAGNLVVTATATRHSVAQSDQPTAVRAEITVDEYTLTVSQFIRWCGATGWEKADVRKVLDTLGIPTADKTLNAQHHDGRRQATGKEPLYGPVPADVPLNFAQAVTALAK